MGASGSIYWEALNDELTEDEVKTILGDAFNEQQFCEVRDKKTGLVSRNALMEIIHNHKLLAKEAEVKEIYHLFIQICPNGEMSRNNFISFCKEARLLSKKQFPRVDADIMFEKALKVPKIVSKTMDFRNFMKILVPMIAEKMKLEVDVVLHRLASVDQAPTEDDAGTLKMAEADMTKEERAAMRIQTSSRRLTATKKQKGIVEARKSALSAGKEFFDVPADENDNDEKKLCDVFITVCNPKTEMDVATCLDLCKRANLIDGQFFTNHDVQLVFLKAKSIAMNNASYSSGVVVGKMLTYKIFREIVIPCLAEKRTRQLPSAESKGEVIKAILQVPSDNVEVQDEASEALKSFFNILQHGAEKGETVQMNRVLDS